MRKLLVPVDNSDNAIRALQHAIGLAKEIPALELHIVYAHEPPDLYGEVAVYLDEEKARELQEKHSRDVLGPAVRMAAAAGVKFTSHVLIGNVPASVVKCAEDLGCDGIVMGTLDRNQGRPPQQASGDTCEVTVNPHASGC